ncbi:hypothetical protein [Actinomadura sp. CNU-125]|uniref:hypothetical protein n=1 Tax=Actinomadura sp. CNU-125 TaxID=1904961 RepID=UPI000A8BE322|nr:hypothetical protein [Actinomadura sp. CNU-125]
MDIEHLPSGAIPKPVWLWWSGTGATPADVDLLWQAFLRRFDIEHTFRLLKQTLGWICPKVRTPQAADRWTWIMLAAYTQLRLARPLTADLRRPWERPAPPQRLTPARVRRGFRHLRPQLSCPASAPKPPGPAQDGPQAAPTPTPLHATTCTSSAERVPHDENPRNPRTHDHAGQVKDQARRGW